MAQSKKDLSLNNLRDCLLHLDLTPSAHLDQKLFSKHYKLSRIPLHEVFQKLAEPYYLNIGPNRGAVVAIIGLYTIWQICQTATTVNAVIVRCSTIKAGPTQIHAL